MGHMCDINPTTIDLSHGVHRNITVDPFLMAELSIDTPMNDEWTSVIGNYQECRYDP